MTIQRERGGTHQLMFEWTALGLLLAWTRTPSLVLPVAFVLLPGTRRAWMDLVRLGLGVRATLCLGAFAFMLHPGWAVAVVGASAAAGAVRLVQRRRVMRSDDVAFGPYEDANHDAASP